MKTLLLLLVGIMLYSCAPMTNITDGIIIIHSRKEMHKKCYYKYRYNCYQNGYKLQIYSNEEYKDKQALTIN